jgi:hypothetical protein
VHGLDDIQAGLRQGSKADHVAYPAGGRRHGHAATPERAKPISIIVDIAAGGIVGGAEKGHRAGFRRVAGELEETGRSTTQLELAKHI